MVLGFLASAAEAQCARNASPKSFDPFHECASLGVRREPYRNALDPSTREGREETRTWRTMDVSSFNAVYKFVAKQHGQAPPPRLVLAVLTYLEGLGYEVVCSGEVALKYAAGDILAPARHRGVGGEPSSQGSGETSSYWYVLDMVHDNGIEEKIDQMSMHVRMTWKSAFVHCSRTAWIGARGPAAGPTAYQRVDVATSGFDGHTSCTLHGDDMIELQIDTFDDGVRLRHVEELCVALQTFFCKGSTRDAARLMGIPVVARGIVSRPISGPTGRDGYIGVGGSENNEDMDRLRVGQSDLDPIDRRGSGRGLGPDGMMVGPHHPIFGRGRMEPPPGHEGHLPPGARWDPVAPPGMPGFFPGDFERGRGRGRGRSGEDIHPDIMQPGRGGFGGGFGGDEL